MQIKHKTLAIKAAINAGNIILSQYYKHNNINNRLKKDLSPISLADELSHRYIYSKLKNTLLPVLSEEGGIISYEERKRWSKFWLIDPLDGTKEFINKNGEFTVNIALIENQIPILGVVYAPVTGELYYAGKDFGSFKIESIKKIEELNSTQIINLTEAIGPKEYTILVSRSHMNKKTLDFIKFKKKKYKNIIINQCGSSLKICKIAEGKAHCYPRLGPTMEWDTAAAHAVVKYSGKSLVKLNSKDELIYNKESLLNPFFVVE